MPRVKLFDENEVLTKAMNLFWKQGYAATSVQDLVTHLGINRASLYDTFGDKEQLFKKSFELYRKTNIEGLKHFLDSQKNDVILSVQQAYFDLLKNHKLLEADQVAVERSQAQLDRAQKMYELGATARVDVYRAQVNYGNDRIAMLSQKNVLENAKKTLNLDLLSFR